MKNIFLILGQTGLNKQIFLEKFCKYSESTYQRRGPSIKIIKFEEHLVNDEGKPFSNLTWRSKGISNKKKLEIWGRSFDRLIEDENIWDAEYVFLEMHAVHYVHGSFYFYLVPEKIKALKPKAIVVLMDDLVGIYNNIDHEKLREEQQGLIIEPRDAIYWRALEFHVAEHLCMYVSCHLYWLAIRSHPETFRKLLENEISGGYKKVYISFPITATRASSDAKTEIDEFRTKIYGIDRLIVFDPVTVDDLRWKSAESKSQEVWERWPLSEKHYTLCPQLGNTETVPPGFLKNYYYIKRQIDERDLILVRQSDNLLVYRPLFNGIVATGCFEEMKEAAKNGMDIAAYIPREDEEKATSNPFNSALISDIAAVRTIKNKDDFFAYAIKIGKQ